MHPHGFVYTRIREEPESGLFRETIRIPVHQRTKFQSVFGTTYHILSIKSQHI